MVSIEFDRAHLGAAAQILRVRGHAHGFLAAGDGRFRIAVEERLIAKRTVRKPLPQSWLTPQAGLSTGMPAAIEAWRPGSGPAPRSGSGP